MNSKIIKKSDMISEQPPCDLSPFQMAQARVKSINAIKTLEFYGEAIADPEFRSFLRDQVSEVCVKLAA